MITFSFSESEIIVSELYMLGSVRCRLPGLCSGSHGGGVAPKSGLKP